MKKIVSLLFLASLAIAILIFGKNMGPAQDLPAKSADEYRPNEVLVRFKDDAETSQIRVGIVSIQAEVINYMQLTTSAAEWDPTSRSKRSFLNQPYLLHIRVPESISIDQAISSLKQNPLVDYAEPNALADFYTNDTHYSKLWGMNNTGQTGGTQDADIDAPEAWSIFTGSSDMVVGVVDTGISYNHEDLSTNIWSNPGETGGGKETDGIDNDGNGYIDDWHGWDFVTADNDPDDYYSPVYHGTHVAGIIGALGDNDKGVVGVCWTVKLMALRGDDLDSMVSAVYYAVDNGAKVINASWGFSSSYQSLYEAIDYAKSKGVLIIAAAGNNGDLNNDAYPHYPSSYTLDNIIAVLATTHDDDIASYSHYGQNSVDLGAPGGSGGGGTSDIYSTMAGDSYQYLAGTSMATPHVTGAAALAWGKCPDLTYDQLRTRILNKTDLVAALNNKCTSNGRLNAYSLIYDSAVPDGTPDSLGFTWCTWNSLYIAWADNSSNEIGFSIQRQKSGESGYSSIKSVNAGVTSYLDSSVNGGTVYYKVRAYNMAGNATSDGANTTVAGGAPTAPSDLIADDPTLVHHVVLTWQDNATNEQTFVIQRRPSGGGQWTNVATINPIFTSQYPTVSYTDTQVNQGNYYYRIKATNPNGYSYSTEIYVEVEGI